MPFQPQVNQELTIDDVTYRIAEHPAAPGIPYGQEGRQAIVYQLVSPSPSQGEGWGEGGAPDRRALKVFKPRYRLPEMVSLAERIAPLTGLPGLQVCQRTVLTPQRHASLLRQHPDLTYAILMPWVAGPTWMEVLIERRALVPEESLVLARSLAGVLAGMEQRRLAHCDLSGPNVILSGLLPSPRVGRGNGGEGWVALVDIEQLYGPGLERPELLPGGSPGYAHKTAPQGLWSATADRFAGAVLLGEMLGWCDERVREASWGENYFDPQEMQRESERFQILVGVLEQRWGTEVAGLFERAWRSEVLADCATFGEWLVVLPEEVPVPVSPGPLADEGPEEKVKAGENTLKMLMDLARRLEGQGNVAGAVEVYRQAQAMAPTGSGLAKELALIVQDLEGKLTEAVAPGLQPVPAEKIVEVAPPAKPPVEEVKRETTVPTPESPLEEGTEAEPAAPTPGTALEQELALIVEEVAAEPQEEVPSPELQPPVVEAEAEVARLPAGEEADLDRLFDEGLAAFAHKEWAEARELLGEVARRQPGYTRGGYEAWALLAETERQLAPPRWKRALVWVWALLGGLVLVIAGVIYSNYQARQRAIVEQMEATTAAQYQATITAQARATLAMAATEVTSTPRSTSTPRATATESSTATPAQPSWVPDGLSVVESYFIHGIESPAGLTWDGRQLWIVDRNGTVHQLDSQGYIVQSFPLAGPYSDGLTWDGEYLWYAETNESHLYQLNSETGRVLQTFQTPGWGNIDDLAWDGEYLWATSGQPYRLYKVDLASGVEVDSMPGPIPPTYTGPIPSFDGENTTELWLMGLTWDGEYLWVSTNTGDLLRIDHENGSIVGAYHTAQYLTGLAWDGQCLWAIEAPQGILYRILVTGTQITPTAQAQAAATVQARATATPQAQAVATGSCDPSADQVALFVDSDYGGRCVVKDIGQYPNPNAIGLPNDSISSIKVGGGVQATLYEDDNYQGRYEFFASGDSNLQDNIISDDIVSSVKVQIATTVRLTLVTGDNGTVDNPVFELLGTFDDSPYQVVLDKPNDLQPGRSDIYEFTAPMEFCEITAYQLTKPAGPGGDDDWVLDEIYISLSGVEVYFDRAVDDFSPVTSTSFPPNGSWVETMEYKQRCND